MRSRSLFICWHTVIGRCRDWLEFSREFKQTEALFEKTEALFFCKVPLFEKTVALNFPKVAL